MSLEMKTSCLRCSNELRADGIAFICSHECTFCGRCAQQLDLQCSNCKGELIRRPRRNASNE